MNIKANSRIDGLLASYPRVRPALSPDHAAIYVNHYRWSRGAQSGLSQTVGALESWMHRTIAAPGKADQRILEIGAGNLNHVPYESGAAVYDAVEPFKALWSDSPYLTRVTNMYTDIEEVPEGRLYDRVISIAVLEHLTHLPSVLARSGHLLAANGCMQAAIPTEGGFSWGLAWRSTTAVAFRLRHGLSYAELMRHEHINRAREILDLASFFFRDVRIRRFPLPFFHFSFYTVIEAANPRIDRCSSFFPPRA